jgi:hypothetical protein
MKAQRRKIQWGGERIHIEATKSYAAVDLDGLEAQFVSKNNEYEDVPWQTLTSFSIPSRRKARSKSMLTVSCTLALAL